jgi:hypothetical protein
MLMGGGPVTTGKPLRMCAEPSRVLTRSTWDKGCAIWVSGGSRGSATMPQRAGDGVVLCSNGSKKLGLRCLIVASFVLWQDASSAGGGVSIADAAKPDLQAACKYTASSE